MENLILIASISVSSLVAPVAAQDTFQNLNFEQGSVSGSPGPEFPASAALPGWNVYLNGSPSATIGYDYQPLDGWGVSVADAQFPLPVQIPISGRFSVYLRRGRDFFGAIGVGEIAQVGAVPTDSHSLFFASSYGVPTVSFKGETLPVILFQANATSTTYAADITQYAGQTGELRFSPPLTVAETIFDDIQFSPQVVPEPSTLALILAGAGLLSAGLARRKTVARPN